MEASAQPWEAEAWEAHGAGQLLEPEPFEGEPGLGPVVADAALVVYRGSPQTARAYSPQAAGRAEGPLAGAS